MGYDMSMVTAPDGSGAAEARALMDRLNPRSEGGERERWLAAYDRWNKDRGYFRLNGWGMAKARDVMEPLGMVHWVGEHPPFPEPASFGLPRWPDEEDTDPRAVEFLAAVEQVLVWTPEYPGIPGWKLSSNDGWIVTPIEIMGALHQLDTAESIPELPEWWAEWVAYLLRAVEHDGFRVY